MTKEGVHPFPIDAQVMARIRPLTQRDLARVVALHRAAMGNSLWARLGPEFMNVLYRRILKNETFLGFVYEEYDRVRGFIAGTTNSERLFRDVLKAGAKELILPTLVGVFRDPKLVGPLLSTPSYWSRSEVPGADIHAESLFCSFEPDLRGKRISGHINKVLFDEFLSRGHQKVKITTESGNEGAVRQLTSWGFDDAGHFRFYGKEMTVYVLDLEKSARVDAVGRLPRR